MRVSLACLLALVCAFALVVCGSPLDGSSELGRLHAVMDQWDENAIMPLLNNEADIDRLEAAVQPHDQDLALIEQSAESDSDQEQEIDVVVDSSAADKAEADAEENAIIQNEVDAELDTDSESESSHEAEVEASDPEIAAAKSVLNAVVDEQAEDYPSLAEVASDAEDASEAETDTDADADSDADAEAEADSDSEADEVTDPASEPCALGASDKDASGPVVMVEIASDSDQEIDVVVDSSAADKAEADAEENAIIQNEVDAELDTDSESDSTHEAEVEASDPEIDAAKSVLNAVVDEQAEDYPSLAEVSSEHDPIVHAVVWSGQGGNIDAKLAGEIDPVIIKASAKKIDAANEDRSLITMSFEAMNAGCGSGPTRSVTPQLHFKQACMQHDVCYNRCNVSQLQCDNEFNSDMIKICRNKYPGTSAKAKAGFKVCSAGAAIYYRVVRVFGSTPFGDSQAKFCPLRRSSRS